MKACGKFSIEQQSGHFNRQICCHNLSLEVNYHVYQTRMYVMSVPCLSVLGPLPLNLFMRSFLKAVSSSVHNLCRLPVCLVSQRPKQPVKRGIYAHLKVAGKRFVRTTSHTTSAQTVRMRMNCTFVLKQFLKSLFNSQNKYFNVAEIHAHIQRSASTINRLPKPTSWVDLPPVQRHFDGDYLLCLST